MAQEISEYATCKHEGCKATMYNTLVMIIAAGWRNIREGGQWKWYCPEHGPKWIVPEIPIGKE